MSISVVKWTQKKIQIHLLDTLATVVQTLDSAIHRINHNPTDKYQDKPFRYRLYRDLSVDSAIHRITHYPADNY